MGLFNRRKRKTALRTQNTYTQDRMTQDHLASTALFFAATAHTPVDPEAQREDAREDTQNYDLTDDNDTPVTQDTEPDDAPDPTPEPVTEQDVTTPNDPYVSSYDNSASGYDYGSSSSSYDSGSSYSSSYDSGGSSYDSGSSGGGFD